MSGSPIVAVGDACLSITLGRGMDPAVNSRCVALAAALERRSIPGVRDVLPTYDAVAVYFDPRATTGHAVRSELENLARQTLGEPARDSRIVEIEVRYGGDAGPDLPEIAAFAGCSQSEVIRLHTSVAYRVYMIGFLPGFGYMGSVDARIAMPRLGTPRLRVPEGSVGIAGAQTGVYPCETPGGWRILGRTSAKLFDLSREEPSLLNAGDTVRFVAV